jgi:hypothetical protein
MKPEAQVPTSAANINEAKRILSERGRLIDSSEIQREDIGLSNGASATVYRAMYRGQMVAVKYMKATQINPTSVRAFIREVLAFLQMSHPNLV